MALFKRAVTLQEAVSVIRGALEDNGKAPLPVDLLELSASLRRREPAAPAWAVQSDPPPQAIIEAFPDAAGMIEPGCRFVASNVALDKLLAGRTVGRTVLQATRSDELNDLASRALAGWGDRAELTLPGLDSKCVSAVAGPLPGSRALVVLRDLTTQKRADAVRRDFIANASHELRTPVSAISGAVETLLGMPLDDGGRAFAEMIARQATRLSRLTSDLLDLSRLESGQWPVELGAYSVQPICESAIQLVKERAAAKSIVLGADVPTELSVRGDARAVEQILVNLLDNAIKYTPVGGRARADGGTGLGLAIVKHLVQAQGGEAGVESGRGGSRFWIRVPAAS